MKRTEMRWRGAAIVAGVVGLCATALADQPGRVPTDERFERMIAQMDAPDLLSRERASELFDGAGELGLDAVLDALGRDDLSAEQRARLEMLGRSLFETLPRAGLGVQFDQANARRMPGNFGQDNAVRLARVIENFPASKHLRDGDTILSIDGVRLRGTRHMQLCILSRFPGETMRMTVERVNDEGAVEILEFDVELGRYEDLNNGVNALPSQLQREIFAFRVARHLNEQNYFDDEDTIGGQVSGEAWLRAENRWDPIARRGFGDETDLEALLAVRILQPAGQDGDEVGSLPLNRGDPDAMIRALNTSLRADQIVDPLELEIESYRIVSRELARMAEKFRVRIDDAMTEEQIENLPIAQELAASRRLIRMLSGGPRAVGPQEDASGD